MIAKLKMPESIRNQSSTVNHITIKEHIQSWRKQKESTASDNVTGVSFSHYIAGTYNPHIAEFDTLIHSLPYQYGFSPKNWPTISDVEILKKAGEYEIEKMRTNNFNELRIQYQQQKTRPRHDEECRETSFTCS